MADGLDRQKVAAHSERIVTDILKAAMSWAREVPPELHLPIRAVCVRLAEMVADQRHYLTPLPEPRETERRAVLERVAESLRSGTIVSEIRPHLQAMADRELRATGSWSANPEAHTEWVTSAIAYLDSCGEALPAGQRPDPYWADDVVGGIVVSVKAILGTDELHVRIESQYSGGKKPPPNTGE